VEVDEEYIRDNFNLHGLREKVQLFRVFHKTILDKFSMRV
jgi:hypothetical protein